MGGESGVAECHATWKALPRSGRNSELVKRYYDFPKRLIKLGKNTLIQLEIPKLRHFSKNSQDSS